MTEVKSLKFTKQLYIEDLGPRKVESIQFSVFSGDEIRKAGEVQVWNHRLYDEKVKQVANGVLDPRMGPSNSRSGKCATCDGNFKECPGHFGYLTLARPVYNVGYYSAIIDILKCICKSCARVLLPEKIRIDFLRKMRGPKREALEKISFVKQIIKKCKPICSRCGYVNGVVKKGGSVLGIVHDRFKISDGLLKECISAISHPKDSKSPQMVPEISPVEVLSLFKRMLDEDCELLYLSDRPEKLLITDIPVPPLAIRPSVFVDGGKRSNENDVTSKLRSIIGANAVLKQDLDGTGPTPQLLDDLEDLQANVGQYISGDVRPSRKQLRDHPKPLSGLVQRLKGKQGRFRGNLSGKRTEFTGRTVISPDPNLKISEVAIPILMAQILTYPEQVSQHNIEKLRQCVRNGPNKYPGAIYIRCPGGFDVHLQYKNGKRAADELKYGQIVDRHLEDGDIVLFNRQPSLHRMSIMSHRARIMPWRTLRFNESVCNPYNADFDGDEMNMHVPQTEEARTEALTLMGVQNNLCTPKNGEILVASTQDFLTSSFLITRKDTFYDRAAFCLMCSYMGDAMDLIDLPTPSVIKPVELWTGKQLFSVLVRPYAHMKVFLNLTVLEKPYDKDLGRETLDPMDGFIYFRNSELICGQLGKATLGNGNKDGLFSVLLRDYNELAAASCMNRLAKLSARWIGNHGFSIGIDDVQPGELLTRQKKETIQKGYEASDDFIQLYNKGNLPLEPGFDAAETLEVKITGVLNKIREDTGKVCMQELHWRNSPLIMSQCGSKGSPINISQMVACVGQQSVGGKRAANGFIDRSLPHFLRNSKAPSAKGFVGNSFYSGLSATEFFFHTMAGREGLVDTAVKTAETGYMSRKLMKGLEDLSIQYDETVRNSGGGVIQFCYGDDGMDPAKMEGKSGFPLNLERLYLKTKATCPPRAHATLSPSEVERLVKDRFSRYDMTTEGGCSESFRQSLWNFLQKRITTWRNTRMLLRLDEEKVETNNSDIIETVAANISGITFQQLEVFLETCISRYHLKRIEAGAAVGAIGAQSIGEPGTQMTLKTFHFAGVASMNITQGVPRIKEIMNGAKNISTPVIEGNLESNRDVKSARIVKGRIEKTVLGEVSKSIKVQLMSQKASIIITLDIDIIQALQLSISAHTVRQSILQHPRIKLKQQNIECLDDRKLRVYPAESDRSKLHFDLHTLKATLTKVVVNGISTVERVVITKEKDKKTKEESYKLHVEGKNLRSVMGTLGVDGCKTISNHIMEVQDTLGIEAARKSIVVEIKKVMESHGMSIDIRHMMLLADVMTTKGEVLGITRFGIGKMKESVLMLASFERATDHLFSASVNGRADKIDGVSECIIMGIPMTMGSGIIKVKQRNQIIPKLTYGPDPVMS